MQPVVVQRFMEYTDIQLMLNTYTSVFDEFKQKEIDKVNQYFLKGNMIENQKLIESSEDEELERE